MLGLYRKRRGLGKCEANRFLMNLAVREGDSAAIAKTKIDKTFVIQNLFPRLRKSGTRLEIFLNYSLDSKLSPKQGAALAEPVDNHPQAVENKR
jgi:hypothetical protein